ncbi:aromatic ring-hydroxylating dioxygenase subunit alpha [Caenimonas sp. SL110]|uniref:aromatic ring-hydroxylating dioxygenase subunit alpha n=1 Tax=Caenimonas sp. SL110 TaxID=1450524 RepID=UPI000654A24A|nr:aromatic ring-hydroxylating dioxygenase subunit alpha [Caenimonas sp. SL110]
MFLKNCWYVAAWDHELIDGKLLARTLLEERVVLYKGDSGDVVALKDRCCHRGAPLSLGRREGDCIRCMYHGLKFDQTGKCVQIPGQDNIPAKLGVRSYPVVLRDHLVWIWMGEPELANPDDILDFPYLRDPQWKGIPGYLHYDANWLLIVDNLSDFAHLAFVHTKTLGGSEEYAYVTKPVTMERLERGFRVERWHMNAAPPPFHKKVLPAAERVQNVDRRNIGHMHIPGNFFLFTLFSPAGSGAEKGNLQGAREYRNCQFMTPETRSTSHHFWIYLNNFEGDDTTISRSLHASLIEGFMEDKHIIEAQQKAMEEDPDFKLLAVVADAPLVHFRRVFDALVAQEQADQALRLTRTIPIATPQSASTS